MARIDHDRRELGVTVLVLGPRRAGKSALLRAIRERLPTEHHRRADAHGLDEPLLDWLPLDLGRIATWQVHLDLYALAGNSTAEATRQLLLGDADGLLLVADSQAVRLDDNLDMLQRLERGLARTERGAEATTLPRVFCYSKQDLPAELVLTPARLDAALNPGRLPAFGADLLRGRGVLDPLHALMTLVLRQHAPAAGAD